MRRMIVVGMAVLVIGLVGCAQPTGSNSGGGGSTPTVEDIVFKHNGVDVSNEVRIYEEAAVNIEVEAVWSDGNVDLIGTLNFDPPTAPGEVVTETETYSGVTEDFTVKFEDWRIVNKTWSADGGSIGETITYEFFNDGTYDYSASSNGAWETVSSEEIRLSNNDIVNTSTIISSNEIKIEGKTFTSIN